MGSVAETYSELGERTRANQHSPSFFPFTLLTLFYHFAHRFVRRHSKWARTKVSRSMMGTYQKRVKGGKDVLATIDFLRSPRPTKSNVPELYNAASTFLHAKIQPLVPPGNGLWRTQCYFGMGGIGLDRILRAVGCR